MHTNLIEKTNFYIAQNQKTNAIVQVELFAKKILDEIIASIQPGISEAQATEAALQIFAAHQIDRVWHRPHVRFNQNTLCTFKDIPSTSYILQEDDIAFIDIGIVKDGIEGDVGKTIVFGDNSEFLHLKNTSEILFQEGIAFWKQENPSGIQLYEYISAQAQKHHVQFNLAPAGHLIGAFPHTHAWTKGANTYPETLSANGWILEIQIKSLTKPFGAFFEGLLG